MRRLGQRECLWRRRHPRLGLEWLEEASQRPAAPRERLVVRDEQRDEQRAAACADEEQGGEQEYPDEA